MFEVEKLWKFAHWKALNIKIKKERI